MLTLLSQEFWGYPMSQYFILAGGIKKYKINLFLIISSMEAKYQKRELLLRILAAKEAKLLK